MDYTKSGDWEPGMVIEHHEWVEGTEIRYQRSDIRVGMGSNILGVLYLLVEVAFTTRSGIPNCVAISKFDSLLQASLLARKCEADGSETL